ncbi:MAG TPA: hypothetical protein VHM90_17320 [Phycisphaerae bacterium]|nr:hypothetical protein [Phycisphaerae bacterium]
MHESETSTSLDDDQQTLLYQPGTRVRVTQQIPRRTDALVTVTEGKVVRQERQKSGSWYARNKNAKVWLDRLILEKPDGEISILNLDEYSVVQVLEGPEGLRASSPLMTTSQDPTAGVT